MIPLERLHIVLRDPAPRGIPVRQRQLRYHMPLRRGLSIPSDRLDCVPGNTSTFAVHRAKRELRLR